MKMNILFSCTVLFFLFLMSSVHAQSAGFGICRYDGQTVSSVICYGQATLNKTSVTGATKVAGSLRANASSLNTLSVNGTVDAQDTTIQSDASVTGYLISQNSYFEHGLVIATDHVKLSSSTVTGTLEIDSTRQQPVLQLMCHSTITDSVIFGKQAGIVEMTSDSIIKGKVENGTIQMVEKIC